MIYELHMIYIMSYIFIYSSFYYIDKLCIFGVVLASESLISCSFAGAKRSAILFVFFTTNRILSDIAYTCR